MQYTMADLMGAENVDLGAGEWLTIGQERIDRFARCTEDQQWIHTDPERAAATPFGGTIAHGYLLLSLVPRLFEGLLAVSDAEMLVNFGLDKVRFIKPVPSESEIQLMASLESATERKGNLLLRVRGTLKVRLKGDNGPGRRAVALETLFLAVAPDEKEGA